MEIHWDIVIWSTVNFLVLLLLLRLFLWKPILEIMKQRETKISQDLEQAENAREQAIAMKQDYENRLAEAQAKTEQLLEDASRRAEEIRQELLSKAQQEADEVLKKAEAAIAREREAALAELRGQVAELAILVAEKVLQREIDDEDQRRLARSFAEQVGGLR